MKEFIFVLLSSFVFASTVSAAIYKWTDERGVVAFTNDPDKIPPAYRSGADEVDVFEATPSRVPFEETAANIQGGLEGTQAPSIAQTLVREGDFAIKLAESLRLGLATGEAEAESILASAGISPRNGWIADYPLTPDIIGELQNSIAEAADSGRLAMTKDEAINALLDLTAQNDLPLRPDNEGQDTGAEPPQGYAEYSNPTVVNNYYYNEGPPVVTYYPPPPDYRYLYVWVPYPFWCSQFRFKGFFVLNDFDRAVFANKRLARISNHVTDPETRRVFPIDPVERGTGESRRDGWRTPYRKGFSFWGAERGATSILTQSQDRTRPGNSKSPEVRNMPGRQASSSVTSSTSQAGSRAIEGRPSTINQWTGKRQAEIGSGGMRERSYNQQSNPSNVGKVPSARSSVQTPKASIRSGSLPKSSSGDRIGNGGSSGRGPAGGRGR